jgi:hypothetical protein
MSRVRSRTWRPATTSAQEHRSTAVYASADDVELIHGHGGQTRLVWLDPPPARGGWTADRLQVLRQVARRQDIMRRLGTIP